MKRTKLRGFVLCLVVATPRLAFGSPRAEASRAFASLKVKGQKAKVKGEVQVCPMRVAISGLPATTTPHAARGRTPAMS